MNDYRDLCTVTRQRLVNGVVHELKHHVVQARAIICIPDIHSRAFTHGIEAFKYLDTRRVVGVFFAHSRLYIQFVCSLLAAYLAMFHVEHGAVRQPFLGPGAYKFPCVDTGNINLCVNLHQYLGHASTVLSVKFCWQIVYQV